jgi:hypothetical protein
MAGFRNLPTEIILIIIKFFNAPAYWPDLLALCLSSRQLYALAQPMLFDRYQSGIYCDCCDCQYSTGSRDGLCSLLGFTRTILSRPDLGSRVREMTIDTSAWESREPERWSETLTAETIPLLADAVQAHCMNNKALFLSSIVRAQVTPLILLLCTFTPNLEEFDLTLGEKDLKDLRSSYMPSRQKDLVSPYLPRLRRMVIRGTQGQMNTVQADTLSFFLGSSRLECFYLSWLAVKDPGDPGFMPPFQSLDIVQVCLVQTCLNTKFLRNLICACKGLKRLIYRIDSDIPNLVELSEFAGILNLRRQTLEYIEVDLDLYNWALYGVDYPRIESFASFTNLQHLEVEQRLLTDNPELPDSLRHLVICACEDPVTRLLQNLTRRSLDNLDSLESVVLRSRSSPPNGMLGLSERFDSDEDVHENTLYRSALKRACRRLRKIVREAYFDFDVRCEEWDLFEDGLL